MSNKCPHCGDTHLRAEKTKLIDAQNQNKFDIYCRNCGYIATGNVILEDGTKVKDADIKDVC